MELSLEPLVGKAESMGLSRSGCGLRKSLAACQLMGGSVSLSSLFFGLRHPSIRAFQVNNLPANGGDKRDAGLTPGSGRYPGEEHGNPLQHSCLENLMNRGGWRATVHSVPKCWT